MLTAEKIRIEADFIVVDPKTILTRGQIEVREGKVVGLQEASSQLADLRLVGRTLLPGLINCHTHLEFSDLAFPFPAQNSFPDWIADVIRHRRQQARSLSPEQLQRARSAAIENGLSEARRFGTSVLVDIATEPLELPDFAAQMFARVEGDHAQIDINNSAPQVFCLPEIIGLDEVRFDHTLQWTKAMTDQWRQVRQASLIRDLGVSPHAPYSLIHPKAIEQVTTFSPDVLVAMHVAESIDEIQWCEYGTGAFHDLYSRIGLPIHNPRMQIEQAIALLAGFERAFLVHGNYLTEPQLDQVARSASAIIYCPRTHQHFRHRPYPLQDILRRDIPLFLGTDSRASNPDLNMWAECRAVLESNAGWPIEEIFAAATIRPAEYLGIASEFGSLQTGRCFWAHTVNTPPQANSNNLLELIMRFA